MAADLDARARAILDGLDYLVLGTVDADGRARTTPVYVSRPDHRTFVWGSDPTTRHSLNIARDPRVTGVVLDTTRPVGHGEAVWVSGTATLVGADELADEVSRFVVKLPDHPGLTVADVSGDAPLRLYRLRVDAMTIHVHGDDPDHGTGADTQLPVTPWASLPPEGK